VEKDIQERAEAIRQQILDDAEKKGVKHKIVSVTIEEDQRTGKVWVVKEKIDQTTRIPVNN
jgi:hypothetical protein